MRLASNEAGKSIESLPPGKIYGMSVTKPCETPAIDANALHVQPLKSIAGMWNSIRFESTLLYEIPFSDQSLSSGSTGRISESAIDMLAHLFPHRKRSVLELILRRCDLDLLKAIEQCRPTPSAFKPISTQVGPLIAFIHNFYERKASTFWLLINCIWQKTQSSSSSMEPRSITATATATTVVAATTSPSYCAPMLAAYPKWVFPMSIPFSMDPIAAHHSANSAFKCIFTNCPMCVCQIEKYWARNPVRFSFCGWIKKNRDMFGIIHWKYRRAHSMKLTLFLVAVPRFCNIKSVRESFEMYYEVSSY